MTGNGPETGPGPAGRMERSRGPEALNVDPDARDARASLAQNPNRTNTFTMRPIKATSVTMTELPTT